MTGKDRKPLRSIENNKNYYEQVGLIHTGMPGKGLENIGDLLKQSKTITHELQLIKNSQLPMS